MASDSDDPYNADPISDETLETIIPQAVNGDINALKRIVFCDWLMKLLKRISACARNNYSNVLTDLNCEELEDYLHEKIRTQITSLKKKEDSSWRESLEAWSYVVVENRCRNKYAHAKVVRRYEDDYLHAHTTIRNRKRVVDPMSERPSVQDELEKLELEKEYNAIQRIVRKTVRESSPKDRAIILLWSEWLTVQQIEAKMGIPYQSVSNRQKHILRSMVTKILRLRDAKAEALDMGKFLKGRPELRDGFRNLIANSLDEPLKLDHPIWCANETALIH